MLGEYEKYHQYGFEILGISLSDSKKQLLDFSKVYGVKYPLLYGSYKEIDEITVGKGVSMIILDNVLILNESLFA